MMSPTFQAAHRGSFSTIITRIITSGCSVILGEFWSRSTTGMAGKVVFGTSEHMVDSLSYRTTGWLSGMSGDVGVKPEVHAATRLRSIEYSDSVCR